MGRDAKKAFGPEGGSLGRGISCNWQLPDPTNTLSARHAMIGHNGIGFTITDTSTNGVYINMVDAPLGRGNTAPLADGDTLYLASYIIAVSIESDPVDDRQRLGLTSNAVRIGGGTTTPGAATFPSDNIKPAPVGGLLDPSAQTPVDPLLAIGGSASAGISMPSRPAPAAPPALQDPLLMLDAQMRAESPLPIDEDLLRGRPTPAPMLPDGPHLRVPPGQFPPLPGFDQLQPPVPPAPSVPPRVEAPSPPMPKAAIIPDHFDFSDLLPGGSSPPPQSAAPAIPVMPAPLLSPPPPPVASVAPAPQRKPLGPALANDLVALRAPGASPPMPGERVLDPLAVLKERAAQRSSGAALPPEPRPTPAAALPMPGMPNSDELRVFWEALGLDANLVPPERRQEVLAELGQALREMANGLHAVLAARAMVKNEFHIEQTRIRSGDNNPFKFFKSGPDALRKSLGNEQGYMPLSRSVREGFHDIKAHEVASMMAMRAAISNVLTQMSPQRLETDGVSTGLFGGRADKSKLWDHFVEVHSSMVNDIDRTTRTFIADEFTRAYDSQIATLRKNEGKPL
ncbi:type VI secretion system-associated FHA domain protein TagH [Microbacteriaceae bacterium K1510]|nr:type VI secretion system-associated FHA domain protein TagH [Microbacteriaceae bacterium K1510]